MARGYLGVTGEVSQKRIKDYLHITQGYKKILATYDALERLMTTIPNYKEYFLLIDEYHLLFNDYSFRNKAVVYILNNFKKFKDWTFVTATPLKEECILNELKDVDQITYSWECAVPVNMTITDTYFVQRELISLIDHYKDRNLHIFLNSVKTINYITDQITEDYRVVCAESNKSRVDKFAKITDPIKRINFYTSCAFEGADIMDEDGFVIVVCDTKIATTVLDISTKIKQICGRLRNSKYKDQCTLILNTNKHRYANVSERVFAHTVEEAQKAGVRKEELYNQLSAEDQLIDNKLFTPETYYNLYLNLYDNKIFFDSNLKKLDIYNYSLVNEIYKNTISVITEAGKLFIPTQVNNTWTKKGLDWIHQELLDALKDEFTYAELEEMFMPLFAEHKLIWNKNFSIIKYFPEFVKKQKQKDGKRSIVYRFAL